MGALLIEIGFFVTEKLFGGLVSLFKQGVVVNPKNTLIIPKKIEASETRYVLFIINKEKRPYYDLDLKISTAEKLNILVDPRINGEFKPTYPIPFGDPKTPSFIEFGGAFFTQDKYGSEWLQKIHHIEPEQSIKYEVVLSKITGAAPFKLKHEITYSKEAKPISTKTTNKGNQQSIEIHGVNWNLKK